MTWKCPKCDFTVTTERPQKSFEVLAHLYWGHLLSQYQIEPILDVSRGSLPKFMREAEVPTRPLSQAARLRWQHSPLTELSREKIGRAFRNKALSPAHCSNVSRGLRRFYKGQRIISRVNSQGSDTSLFQVHPSAVGAVWQDGDCRFALKQYWRRLWPKLVREGLAKQRAAIKLACTKLLEQIIFQEVA